MIIPATNNAEIDDVNIEEFIPLVTPAELKTELPLTDTAYNTVLKGRNTIQDILGGVRSTCTYVGAARLKELTKRTTFIRVREQENNVYGKE